MNTEMCVGSTIALLVLIAVAIGLSVYDARRHDAFLKAHQCVKVYDIPTGRKVYCGKACFRDEIETKYDCADGPRIEVK